MAWSAENHPPHQWPVGTNALWRLGGGCPTIWCNGEGEQRVPNFYNNAGRR